MKTFRFTLALMLITAFFGLSAQTVKSPSEGKSLIYFVRSNSNGFLINFKYFDGNKYIGKFNGAGYIVYECEPGNHKIWAASENRDFIDAELLPNKSYIIEVIPRMGAMKASVKMFPVSPQDSKRLKRVTKMISKKEPTKMSESGIVAEEKELDFFIKNGLEKYEKDKASGDEMLKIEKDWFHNK